MRHHGRWGGLYAERFLNDPPKAYGLDIVCGKSPIIDALIPADVLYGYAHKLLMVCEVTA